MKNRSDASYYAALEQGAEYLAELATDPAERATHLKIARLYRARALDAAPSAKGTVH